MSKPASVVEILIPYRKPFDWPGVLAFHRAHEMTGIERAGEDFYERVFRFGEITGWLRITRHPERSVLSVSLLTSGALPADVVEARIRRMFALDADPETVGRVFGKHRVMGPLWAAYPGLRPSSGWDAFESSIATVLGQLVSVKRAKDLVRQLVTVYGEKITHPVRGGDAYLFPTPARLAGAGLDEIGTTRMRKRTITEFSRRVASGELDLSSPDIAAMKTALLSIPGIGPWSSEYIAMRALAHHDSFPGADLILKRALGRHPGLDPAVFSPWRSYAAALFWRHHVETSVVSTPTLKPPSKKRNG